LSVLSKELLYSGVKVRRVFLGKVEFLVFESDFFFEGNLGFERLIF
jgi:hypothetical protein